MEWPLRAKRTDRHDYNAICSAVCRPARGNDHPHGVLLKLLIEICERSRGFVQNFRRVSKFYLHEEVHSPIIDHRINFEFRIQARVVDGFIRNGAKFMDNE